MCKWNKWGDTRIDHCMRNFIKILETNKIVDVLACCCGHGKYPMSVVVKFKLKCDLLKPFELFSGKVIPRKKKFYKKDKQGYYYIPEVIENEKK